MEKIEYGVVIKFLTKQGKTVTTIMDDMSSVYGDSCPVLSSAYFEDKDKTFFYEGVNKWIESSEKCVRLAGEYIEKEK